MIPNGANITAHAHYNLQLENVSSKASEADILPTFKHLLLSVGQLCNDDCTAIFSKDKFTIYNHRNEPVITGLRNHSMGLYKQSIPRNSTQNYPPGQCHITNNKPPRTYQISSSMCLLSNTSHMDPGGEKWPFQNMAQHHRRCHPTIFTKIRGNHNGPFRPTTKNTQSTKSQADDHDTMTSPSPLAKGLSTQAMYAATICYNEPTGKLYTDLTGQFPIQSSRGHKYILVAYNYDSNLIHVKPLKSRHDNDTIKAYEEIYAKLTSQGLKPKLHWLDNEASKALKNFIAKEHTEYQLTPPHIHRRKTAERAIRTFKNHFVSGLCSVDKNFSLHLWCRLLDQVELTLNMLRTSRINPNLSTHEQINGTNDFNATPLAPPGTRCIAHEKSCQRGTRAPHRQPGWYVGAAPEHYRCYHIYIPKTQGTSL